MKRIDHGILNEIVGGHNWGNDAVEKFSAYVDFVFYWNRTHNIVSRTKSVDDIWEDVYDSVAVIDFLSRHDFWLIDDDNNIVDAGAGGGFPGVPLAIVFPEIKFQLVDISRKKCSFLRAAKSELKLKNIIVNKIDIEKIEPTTSMVTKAAFSPLHVGGLAKALKKGGKLAFWSTEQMHDQLSIELGKFGVSLTDRFDYFLPSGKPRSLLLFTKL